MQLPHCAGLGQDPLDAARKAAATAGRQRQKEKWDAVYQLPVQGMPLRLHPAGSLSLQAAPGLP